MLGTPAPGGTLPSNNVDSLCQRNGAHVPLQNTLSLMLLSIYRYFANLLLAKLANESSNPDTPKNAFVLFRKKKKEREFAYCHVRHALSCWPITAIEHGFLNLWGSGPPVRICLL